MRITQSLPYSLKKNIGLNIFIAALYIAVAHVSMLLSSIPPGYATAVWPAAGIVLGAMLVYGPVILPAIFIGALSISAMTVHQGYAIPMMTPMISLCMAIGVCLQAVVGFLLVKKIIGLENPLCNSKSIILFSLISGPAASLTNAIFSNACLYFIHALHHFWLGVGVWWVADSLGVLIFTPCFLTLFAEPKKLWRSRIFSISLPLLICFFATVTVYFFVDYLALKQIHYQLTPVQKSFSYMWMYKAYVTERYLTTTYSSLAWFFLIGGLFFCALMNIILFILQGQKHMVQQEVEKRTSELMTEQAKNQLLLTSAAEGICQIGLDGKATFVNPAAANMLGYTQEEMLGKNIHAMAHYKHADGTPYLLDDCPMYASLKTGETHHIHGEMLWKKDGSALWIDYNSSPLKVNEKIIGSMVVFNDISKQHYAEVEMERMAHYDMLTGIPNRLSFQSTLPKAMGRADRHNTFVGVCFLDLDNFKQVNDSLGHTLGDELLKTVAHMLSGVMRKDDFFARLGGDEFGMILENIHKPEELPIILSRYLDLLYQPIHINHQEINISASIGVSIYPTGGKTVEELIKNADIAMYRAKANGRNAYAFFDEAVSKRIERAHQLNNDMRYAIERNEFYLLYQPQVDVQTKKCVGVEALIRWRHPSIKDVSALELIEIAEDNGLIHVIGGWVLKQACLDFLQIKTICPDPHLRLSVNVSVKELNDENYVQRVSEILHMADLAPEQLSLEITESALMKEPKKALAVMNQLKKIGVYFALDDFGTGYSSMAYLKNLPISILKIDQSFIRDIPFHDNDMAITHATIELAHALNMQTIAEGVETEAQVKFLVEQHGDIAQGYYFAKPMTIDELIAWNRIKNHKE